MSLTLTDTLRDIGVAGGVLDIPTYVEDVKSLTDNTKLFLNNSNYFTRNHAAKSASGALVKLSTQDATQKVVIENSDDCITILKQNLKEFENNYKTVSYTHLTLPTNREV